ncbi:hypothetical protein IAU59_005886 [Kwoniella sp. CBS 9459]
MNTEAHSRPLSPQILTPVNDSQLDDPSHPLPILVNSDSEGRLSDAGLERSHCRPVSLLTALIQTADNSKSGGGSGSANVRAASDLASAHSSVPSTAFSSPRNPGHGILQHGKSSDHVGSSSILRKENMVTSSDHAVDGSSVGLGLGGVETLRHRLQDVEAKRERIEWADNVAARKSSPNRAGGLKFAMVPQPSRPVGPSTTAMSADVRMEDHEEEDSDDGYQEDEEGGFDTDSSGDLLDDVDPRYPFARSTNFEQPRFIGSTQIPAKPVYPAPALLPPPSRRGRGHIRVDESAALPGDQDKTCSRHRSPPPTRSRSGSQARSSAPGSPIKRHQSGRLSDAGPREGRAGSPMPGRMSADSLDDDDDDEGEDDEGEVDRVDLQQGEDINSSSGWRSDDVVFYGPHARQVKPIIMDRKRRHSSASARANAVFVDSDDEGESSTAVIGTGVRDLLRRASAHVANFQRPSFGMDRVSYGGDASVARVGSLSGRVSSQSPCPPALDETPAMAQGMFTHEYGDGQGGLAHRLETTLSVPSAGPPSTDVS